MQNNLDSLKKAVVTAVVFAAFFYLCISNMAPSYNSDDSPETTVAFHTLGIQHPPGYPLNTIAGKIFTLIPAGSMAFRANLMAVFFNLLAAFVVFLISRPLCAGFFEGKSKILPDISALIAAAMYIFSTSSWLQGSFAKGSIYALNSFLLALCLWSLFRINCGPKYLYFFSFIYGLSMGNHWTSMAVIAPAVLYYLYSKRKYVTVKSLAISALFFGAGAGVYLFVWLRNAGQPTYVWGDVKTLKDFIWLISRAQYAGAENKHTAAQTAHLIIFYFTNLFTKEYPFFLAAIFLPGVYLVIKRFFKEGIAMLAAFILIFGSVSWFATPPAKTEWIIKPYVVSTYIFVAIFSACAIAYAVSKLGQKTRTAAITAAACFVFLLLAIFNSPGYERYFIGYDYSANLAKSVPEGSVFFAEGDMNVGAVLYLTLVDKQKFTPVIPVVIMYDWYLAQVKRNYGDGVILPPKLGTPAEYIAYIINANPDRKIYYSNVFNNGFINPGMLNPDGIVFKVMRANEKRVITDAPMSIYSYRGLAGDGQKYDEFTQRLVVDNYSMAYFNFADVLRNGRDYTRAAKYYERGLLFAKNSGAYVNLGLVYYNLGDLNKAEESWNNALDHGPQDISLIYTNLAFVYANRKNFQIARDYLTRALAINPNNQTALQLKGVIK